MCIRDSIYCPWDVINFAKKLVSDPSARPSAFWISSSGNDMVKRFVAVSYTHLDVYKRQREVFILQIQEWFKAVVAKDDDTMKLLSRAILDKMRNRLPGSSISL